MVYGVIIIFAALLPVVAGMMCKIVPFLTWMRAYGPKIGRGPTPAAGALTRPGLEKAAFAMQGAAVVPLVTGAWILSAPLLHFGACLLAIGVALFLADMLGVLKHLWWPETGAVRAIRRPRACSRSGESTAALEARPPLKKALP
jgi:hypothetical protein